jgi:hypothetical protein
MIRLFLFNLGLAGLVEIAARWGGSTLIHPQKWIILLFLFILSVFSHLAMRRVTVRRSNHWVGPYLGIITGRLLMSIGFVAFFIFPGTANLYLFVANFFIFYLCFTGFEIYALLANLRRNSTGK